MPKDVQPDSEILIELSQMKMPFGKYKNLLLINLPEPYLVWFSQKGFPQGKLGQMLQMVYVEDCSKLSEQGEHGVARQCFNLLHDLIGKMESGEEIVFADECGTWMIKGDEKRFASSFFTSLAATSTPEEYADNAIVLITGDYYSSSYNNIYAIALKHATKDQRAFLEKKVNSLRDYIKSRYYTT